jgi:hypothetical protein
MQDMPSSEEVVIIGYRARSDRGGKNLKQSWQNLTLRKKFCPSRRPGSKRWKVEYYELYLNGITMSIHAMPTTTLSQL